MSLRTCGRFAAALLLGAFALQGPVHTPLGVSAAGAADGPKAKFAPKKINFKVVFSGEREAAAVAVTNKGNQELVLDIEPPTDPFSLTSAQQLRVAPGALGWIVVEFVSRDIGRHTQTLLMQSNDLRRPGVALPMKARGGPVRETGIDVDTFGLEYGQVPVGTGEPRSVQIDNNAGVTRNLILAAVGSRAFHFPGGDRTQMLTLNADELTGVTVGCRPTSTGRLRGALRITVDHGPPLKGSKRYQVVAEVLLLAEGVPSD
jgi:hypothetical protein